MQQVSKFGRRPLIQVVIIYASNQKVMNYGQKVSDKFINSGVDVLMQTTPNNAPKSKTKVPLLPSNSSFRPELINVF